MIVINIQGREYLFVINTLGKDNVYDVLDMETKQKVGEWYFDKDVELENDSTYYPIGVTFFTSHPMNPMFVDVSSIEDSNLLSVSHQVSHPTYNC